MSKVIFINYRREDSSPAARSLRESLMQAFGDSVFMDVDEIRVGDTWPMTLDNALNSASVLLVVIGPKWLHTQDADGRRRLDVSDDWVRTEIERSFRKEIPVIPVLVLRGAMPRREALPPSIEALAGQQYIELRETHWKQDLAPLISRLESPPLGFLRVGERVPVPRWRKQPDSLPRTLSPEEIEAWIREHPDWKVVISPLPGEYPKTRAELYRAFRFASFDRALEFMREAAPYINEQEHHPRWENVFKTVSVWLSTWDVGHNVSKLDFSLAEHLDSVWRRLKAAAPAARPAEPGQPRR
jgi:pterin-4a-carbinolamine dehydratase